MEVQSMLMMGTRFVRRRSAIFSADVKGYGELMREDELETIVTLIQCRNRIARCVKRHRGRIVDTPGDNVLAEFVTVVDAVKAAVSIQKQLLSFNSPLPANRKMEYRIGIHLGDIIVEGDRIYGDSVNLAARLETLSDPGGVCISRTAYKHIDDQLPLDYEDMGEKRIKGTERVIRAFKVKTHIKQWVDNNPISIETAAGMGLSTLLWSHRSPLTACSNGCRK